MDGMNFPRYWARGRSGNFTAWRWSDTSFDQAQAEAGEAAARLAERFRTQGQPLDRYGYSDRPLREPVLREIRGSAGELAAVVTRNSYGCQVLNTAGAMFVDVDLEEGESQAAPAPGLGGLLGSLFGRSAPPKGDGGVEGVIGKAESWARAHTGWNWRVYRTKAGLRLLATHQSFRPEDPSSQTAFDAVGADPLYRRLCKAQQSFRARLTPKPWRCGVSNPPSRWPFPDAATERRFAEWDGEYQAACRDRATCQYVRSVGSGAISDAIQPLIDLHDQMTRASAAGMPLA